MLEHYINMNNESVAPEGDRLIMRRPSFSSSSDFSIEGKDGAVVGRIAGKDSRKPRPFGRFRKFEIVDASADVLAYVSKVRVPGARGGYALTRQDGSPLAAIVCANSPATVIFIEPADGLPMEFHAENFRHRFDIKSMESQASVVQGSYRLTGGVEYRLDFAPGVSRNWQVLAIAAALAFDVSRRFGTQFFRKATGG